MTIEKKYQVFVSSTYQDLEEERQEIMHALLELDCIPSGMELFPAANEDQWSLIKGVIDDCDYYIVVIGGRYGSLGAEGISYTEMEYRYALEKNKPVIAFLHKDPSLISVKKTEQNAESLQKLITFRELAQKKMCKTWSTPQELGSVVSRSLISLQRKHPGIGWIRGDKAMTKDTSLEILNLRKKIEELESDVTAMETKAPKGTEKLAQGEEKFEIGTTFDAYLTETGEASYGWQWPVKVSWDDLFSALSPLMIHEAKTIELKGRFGNLIEKKIKEVVPTSKLFKGYERINTVKPLTEDFETVLIQLSALGLITQNEKKNRGINDKGPYWTLTPYGISQMNLLRAILKKGT